MYAYTNEIIRSAMFTWSMDDAAAFYAEHKGKFYYDRLLIGITSVPTLGLALAGPNAIREWRVLIGPTKAYRGAWEAPDTLRAQYGLGDSRNGFHGSDSEASALSELSIVFPEWNAAQWLENARQIHKDL